MAAVTLTLRLSTKPRIGTRTRARARARELVVDPLALVAEHDARRAASRPSSSGSELALRVRGDERHALAARPTRPRRRPRVAGDVDPLLGPARHRARHGERRPRPLDDVQALHPERLARPEHGRAVVRVVRPVEDDGDAREAPRDDLAEPRPARLGHERLEHAHQDLRVERLGARDARVDEVVGAKKAGGRRRIAGGRRS